MLHAFARSQNQHQDEQPAMDSQLPIDAAEAIQFALEKRSLDLLLRIKERGDSLNTLIHRKTPLIEAVLADDHVAIKLLIQAGVDVNFRIRTGESALDVAIKRKKHRAMETLLTDPTLNLRSQNKYRENALEIAFDKNNMTAFVAIAQRYEPSDLLAKRLVNKYLYAAVKGKRVEEVLALIKLPQVDIRTKFNRHTILYWAMKTNELGVIKALLPLSRRNADIPLSVLVKDQQFFNNLKNCKEIFEAQNQVNYLDSFSLAEPQVIAALRILELERKAAEREASLKKINGSESAMSDAKVLAANRQFKSKVKPHFEAQFNQIGLNAIECQIRKLIIEEIKENAAFHDDQATLTFIRKNQAALVKGTARAMRASVKVFNQSVVSHAAWRTYNPFAPVTGNWPNLHTRPKANVNIFSTTASNFANGSLKGFEASDIIRERTAYYYLSVVDKNDGDDAVRKNRVGNFIGLLAEIRNTHGLDDPSCFPGQLTRISQMGNYHQVVQLPNDLKEILKNFFRSKIFQQFKEKIEGLSFEEQQQLLAAIINLNHQNAKSIIYNPNAYDVNLLTLRQAFIDSLGNEIKLFDEVKQQSNYAFENDDLVFIQQHLVDVARGDIALALAEYVKRINDRESTIADVKALWRIHNVSPNQSTLFKRILKTIFDKVSSVQRSYNQLQGIAEFIAAKILVIGSQPEKIDQSIQEIVRALECDAQLAQQLEEGFHEQLSTLGFVKSPVLIVNPFAVKLRSVIEQSKRERNLMLLTRLEKMIPGLERKVELFNLFVPYLERNLSLHPAPTKLLEYVNEIVEYCAANEFFNQVAFLKSLPEELYELQEQESLLMATSVLVPCQLADPYHGVDKENRSTVKVY